MSEVKLKLDRVVKKRPVRQNERVKKITGLKNISFEIESKEIGQEKDCG